MTRSYLIEPLHVETLGKHILKASRLSTTPVRFTYKANNLRFVYIDQFFVKEK